MKRMTLIVIAVALVWMFSSTLCSSASPLPSVNILHSFGDGSVASDGVIPYKIILATDGNYYGITQAGGSGDDYDLLSRLTPGGSVDIVDALSSGAIFKMTPTGQVTILHSFGNLSVLIDGDQPWDLIQGKDGNLYGASTGGGDSDVGTTFELQIASSGQFINLHSFADGTVTNDGYEATSLVQGIGTDNNFYGVTLYGGSADNGVVYKMTPAGQITILHSFGDGSVTNDGVNPQMCIMGSDGNLYGTTQAGGKAGLGTLFEMTTAGKETILHNFGDGSTAKDGNAPDYLVQDGNVFYGDTLLGGAGGKGTVFSYSAAKYVLLHAFGDGTVANDGNWPNNLSIGPDGLIYGVTGYGGSTVAADSAGLGYGTLFRLTTAGQETILHNFGDGSVTNDGRYPVGYTIQASSNTLSGVTMEGGSTIGASSTLEGGGFGSAYNMVLAPVVPLAATYVLWNNSGQASLWNIAPSGAIASAAYGPYSGWSPVALSSDTSGNAYILWNSTTGATSVWKVTSSLSVSLSQSFGPYTGWTARSLAVGPDGHVHLLWNQTSDNEISIFNIILGSSFTAQACDHFAGWDGQQVAQDATNNTWVLWVSTPAADKAVVWKMSSSGALTSNTFGPYVGWQPQNLTVGPDNLARLLWVNTSTKQASVFDVASDGTFTSEAIGPYSGWSPADLIVNKNGDSYLIWNSSANQLSLFNIMSNGTFTTSAYGPYSGWKAVAVAPGP